VWLQQQREMMEQRNRLTGSGASSRHHQDHTEFRIGRIKHERVKVPRGEKILDWAVNVLKLHSNRKSILEVEFLEEEGTGLGPTLEFFALVAAEFQRSDLAMWITDNTVDNIHRDKGSGEKIPGYYVHWAQGLFPAPLPQDSELVETVASLFWTLGVFLAKVLQDGRLVDLPLAIPFLKLLCQGDLSTTTPDSSTANNNSRNLSPDPSNVNLMTSSETSSNNIMTNSVASITSESESDCGGSGTPRPGASSSSSSSSGASRTDSLYWWQGLLQLKDLETLDPGRGKFLAELQQLAAIKHSINMDINLSQQEKFDKIDALTLENGTRVEDLSLTFQYSPSSSIYKFQHIDLVDGGGDMDVSIHNLEEYIERTVEWCLHTGIAKQVDALKDGFNAVFPMEKLAPFSPSEVQHMLCGDQSPMFSKEDVMKYTEPKLGYAKDSPGFIRFVNVLVSMNSDERKAFLQFTTGCSSLPPGGLANLHPRLTVVRKIDAGDGSYPSVNTCVHYLKLPDYTSEEILKERLMAATREKGFHLN